MSGTQKHSLLMIKEKLSSSCTVIDLQTRLAKIEQPMQSENKKVNKFLVDISSTFPDKFETVERIREIFLMKNSELDEEIKYGGITFNLSGQLIGGGLFIKSIYLSNLVTEHNLLIMIVSLKAKESTEGI